MHRVRLALSQVKALSWVRSPIGIPSISTVRAQAQRSCAQVIHMFVHSQPVTSPSCRASRRQPISAPGHARRGQYAGHQAPGLSPDEIAQECGPRMLAAALGLRGSAAAAALTAPVAALPPGDLAPNLGRDLGHRGWRSGGCRRAGGRRHSCRAESDRAPPCMRWRGPARPRRTGLASCPALPTPRAARRGQVPARETGLPAPPTFPGSPPGGTRFQR
jgi:hypothetical protein